MRQASRIRNSSVATTGGLERVASAVSQSAAAPEERQLAAVEGWILGVV